MKFSQERLFNRDEGIPFHHKGLWHGVTAGRAANSSPWERFPRCPPNLLEESLSAHRPPASFLGLAFPSASPRACIGLLHIPELDFSPSLYAM